MSYYSTRSHTSSSSESSGIGFTGLLQVAFIILKLCHVIGWPWWWVLAPTWIPTLIVVGIVAGAIIFDAYNNRNANIKTER